ncbi:MAG: type I-E CRISPR-associated protein Cas6/Cse3/CasE [Chloroflexi bacterium]|nr:type I-E CRISPR-associated protein Cas6/Cse3/CasE [Chloroflexota bacterium]
MLYLSRIVLNPKSKTVRKDLADCHQLHRTIMAAFPPAPARTAGARAYYGVLHRLEVGRDGRIQVLVQSRVQPDWSRLPPGYLRDDSDGGRPRDCKRIDEHYGGIVADMTLLFRLRANPTKRIDQHNERDGERWHGRRIDLRDEADQVQWLLRKGEQGGFRVLAVRRHPDVSDVRTTPGAAVEGRRPSGAPTRVAQGMDELTFGSVLFEGRLQVVDADRLRRTLEEGIGSGKAYGFGLLSIAPVREGAAPGPSRDREGAG